MVLIAVGESDASGLYWILLADLFHSNFVGNLGSAYPDVDPLMLFHYRTGDTAVDILREAVRTQLIEGVPLPRSSFSSRAKKKYRCLCDVCARAKIHRRASLAVCRESTRYTVPGQNIRHLTS